jgi:hypothetical protein
MNQGIEIALKLYFILHSYNALISGSLVKISDKI